VALVKCKERGHMAIAMCQIDLIVEAKNYLLSFDIITEDILNAHLNDWKERKPKDINLLFRAFLLHAQNRQGMPNSIGNIDKLNSVLYQFNPRMVVDNYPNWESLFDAIDLGSYKPPGRLDKLNKRSYWVIYCKAIISVANFLSRYISIEEFDTFVEGFLTNEHSRLALPLLVKEEIFGFGCALACDLLKEIGYPEFVKPDTHINDIARALGISKANSDFGIFKDVIAYCSRVKHLPYEVDKLFWLVGSGKFYLNKIKINASKKDFINMVLAKQENYDDVVLV
jgi:hypothetical protein